MKLATKQFTRAISPLLLTSVLAACAPNPGNIDTTTPHTGSEGLESQVGALAPEATKPGVQVFVFSERLRVRTSPEIRDDNVAGVLELNDKVEIVDPKRIGSGEFIAIKVIESKSSAPKNVILFTSAKHLDVQPRKLDEVSASASNFFIIVNVATEKARVYQRCAPNEGCVNRMIFEQDVVNGEDDNGTRTHVGHYRIVDWQKFYETPGKYPAWYKAGYPAVPNPGNRSAWFDSNYMPGGVGDMRGAFGWYTMRVGPNPSGQWMHGTAGWGRDKKDFILFKDTFLGGLINLFTSIRSHGCTRIDNESIAYIRQLVPVGATYIKVYAKEGTRSAKPEVKGYSQTLSKWPYIMTKRGGGVTNNHQLADRNEVLAAGTSPDQWIEEGVLEVDQYPDPVIFDKNQSKHSGGDLYRIGERSFRGVYLVDEGTLLGYHHPSEIRVGGFSDQQMPSFVQTSNTEHYVPQPYNYNYNNNKYGRYNHGGHSNYQSNGSGSN